MALVACDECGREVSTKAAACVGCGAPVATTGGTGSADGVQLGDKQIPKPLGGSEFRSFLWISLVLLLALVGMLLWKVASNAPASPTSAEARAVQIATTQENLLDAVKECEKHYSQMNSDRQYTVSDLRAYAAVCKQLREDYKAKWGREP